MTLPAENAITTCRSCGARIFFARTSNMKNMPLDVKPVRAIVVDPLGPGETQHKMRWVDTWVSHFARCPQASRWREEQP